MMLAKAEDMKASMNDRVIEWAKAHKIDNPQRQFIKLVEEIGELAESINKNKREEMTDAFGDIQVVLIILAHMHNIDYDRALLSAWNVIKDRTGQTKDGSFVKDADLD